MLVLLKYDPAVPARMSPALWLPLFWIFFLGTRSPSQWLNSGDLVSTQAAMEAFNQGSSLDRVVLLLLTFAALGVLAKRSFSWTQWLTANPMLCAFLVFACLSILWSDYPGVALKRWIRDFGSYAVICVVLSDRRPVAAMQVVFRRLGYLFVSLSIVLIKYFPVLGVQYDAWTGKQMVSGVATSKNDLGALCLITGIFFVWDTVTRWPNRKELRAKRVIGLNAGFLILTVWLLHSSHSTTSTICFLLGSAIVISTRMNLFRRRPALLKASVPAVFCLYLILSIGLGMSGTLAQFVGKDPTLTDRTEIWSVLLSMHTNPLIGTGYESFWLGPRLDWFWRYSGQGALNEAHNGYLEVYLEMGLIGDALICGFIVSSYSRIWKMVRNRESIAAFSLAMWMVLVFYNMTEAAFEGTLVFVVFLLGVVSIPAGASKHSPSIGKSKDTVKNLQLAPTLQRTVPVEGASYG